MVLCLAEPLNVKRLSIRLQGYSRLGYVASDERYMAGRNADWPFRESARWNVVSSRSRLDRSC